ncbi:MAG: DUF2141 domain-containing protein [Bacteroidota bacterium]
MNRTVQTAFLFSFSILSFSFAQSQPRGTLEITFTGMRNKTGLVAIGINKSPEGWPRKPDMELNWKKTNAKSGSMTVLVNDLPFGTYGISVLDDENCNLDMDYMLMFPREGFGFSNNVKIKMSIPKFEDCSFVVDKPVKKISIEIRYMNKEK